MTPIAIRLGLAGTMLAALTACSFSDPGSSAATIGSSGSLASSVDLSGVSLTVGSKEFTEQKILGRILVQILKASGAKVKDQTGLAGSTARRALATGRVDLYYEYTGTAWIDALKHTNPVPGDRAQFEAVKTADAKNKITWLAMAPANNTYAIATNQQVQAESPLTRISQYAALANKNPGKAGLCTEAEFVNRDDGLPGLEKSYGFVLPKSQVAQLDYGLVYTSVAKSNPCRFAVVFSTDGQIKANKLTVLQDDKAFFPLYNIAMSMRTGVYTAHREAYDKLFGKLDPLLTNEKLIEMNAAVDVDGLTVEDVADQFLKDNHIT